VSYQVLARKWRPQRFDAVVGQQAVTTTLRNAIATGRLAQAFVFAGARGVGKTTTARILARALNCVKGPTADPCGECDACIEIAQGRDLDVMEIDAATHTGIDNVREVIIDNLGMSPVRDRFKIFIIDEVHRLSANSFDALLKSIEEPPPHVVFIMATTEMGKIPDTILSRSQVYEFRTIATPAIVDQLKSIAEAEGIDIGADALGLIARHAEGSMRDAQSALDQVMAFAGKAIGVDDVSAVLGLVGRDLLFDILTAVAEEDGSAAFTLAGQAVESGHDLRALCRELASLVRALMVIDIDPDRLNDPEVAFEADRTRLQALAGRYSREDLLRSFDLLARAEQEIRQASQPRYALEMTLLKWIHLRKLAPIGELIAGLERGGGALTPPGRSGAGTPPRPSRPAASGFGRSPLGGARKLSGGAAGFGARPAVPSTPTSDSPPRRSAPDAPASGTALPKDFKERFLAEVQRGRRTFFSLHIAQAQRIEVESGRLVLTFGPIHETMRQQVEAQRPWLESVAEAVAGRRVPVTTAKGAAAAPDAPRPVDQIRPAPAAPSDAPPQGDLRARAMADGGVQAMLEVFPAEIRDVEELP
jgi:DNA polymerase III subunit gamma/tau